MMMRAMELHVGSYIKKDGKFWRVVDKTHVKPGKGGAFAQVKLKSLEGTSTEIRYSSSDNVEVIMVERIKASFSYQEGSSIFLTNIENYEDIEVSKNDVSEKNFELLSTFGPDCNEVIVEFFDGAVVAVNLPISIKVKIESADPVVKGQTAASSYKNAIIKRNINIGVPPYIQANDFIIINVYGEKGIEFVERVL